MSEGDERKKRVIHTRVPEALEAELKRKASNLGVSVSNLGDVSAASAQLSLFGGVSGAKTRSPSPEARRRAAEAVDELRGKFGMKAVTLGTLAEEKPKEIDGPYEPPERDERG